MLIWTMTYHPKCSINPLFGHQHKWRRVGYKNHLQEASMNEWSLFYDFIMPSIMFLFMYQQQRQDTAAVNVM